MSISHSKADESTARSACTLPGSHRVDINIARFDLVSMRLAVLCAESGSLSAAAKRAHCSISAGSQRLSALESTLGKHLFIRDYRGLQLTDAGELFVRHARVILSHLQVLSEQVASAEGVFEPCVEHRSDCIGEDSRTATLNSSQLGAATLRLAFPGRRAGSVRVATS